MTLVRNDLVPDTVLKSPENEAQSNATSWSKWVPANSSVSRMDLPLTAGYFPTDITIDPLGTTRQQVASWDVLYNYQPVSGLEDDYYIDADGYECKFSTKYKFSDNEGSSTSTGGKRIILQASGHDNWDGAKCSSYIKSNWNSWSSTYVIDDQNIYYLSEKGYACAGNGDTDKGCPVTLTLCMFTGDRLRALKAICNFISVVKKFTLMYGLPYATQGDSLNANGHDLIAYLKSIDIDKQTFYDCLNADCKAMDIPIDTSTGKPYNFHNASKKCTFNRQVTARLGAPDLYHTPKVLYNPGTTITVDCYVRSGYYQWGHIKQNNMELYVPLGSYDSDNKFTSYLYE